MKFDILPVFPNNLLEVGSRLALHGIGLAMTGMSKLCDE